MWEIFIEEYDLENGHTYISHLTLYDIVARERTILMTRNDFTTLHDISLNGDASTIAYVQHDQTSSVYKIGIYSIETNEETILPIFGRYPQFVDDRP